MGVDDLSKKAHVSRETIYELADHDILVNTAFTYYMRNELSFEEALILMVKTLHDDRNTNLNELLKYKRQYG